MAKDFSELAKLWFECYGEEIGQVPRLKLVEIANECINTILESAFLIPYDIPAT